MKISTRSFTRNGIIAKFDDFQINLETKVELNITSDKYTINLEEAEKLLDEIDFDIKYKNFESFNIPRSKDKSSSVDYNKTIKEEKMIYEESYSEEDDLIIFLNGYISFPMDIKEQNIFRNKFKFLYNAAYGRRSSDRTDRPYGKIIIESIFEELELPYRINNSRNIWVLVKD